MIREFISKWFQKTNSKGFEKTMTTNPLQNLIYDKDSKYVQYSKYDTGLIVIFRKKNAKSLI